MRVLSCSEISTEDEKGDTGTAEGSSLHSRPGGSGVVAFNSNLSVIALLLCTVWLFCVGKEMLIIRGGHEGAVVNIRSTALRG